MSCMRTSTLTIRLDLKTREALNRLSRATGKTQSDLVREALARMLVVEQFRAIRKRILSEAERKSGVLSDEDIFSMVS